MRVDASLIKKNGKINTAVQNTYLPLDGNVRSDGVLK